MYLWMIFLSCTWSHISEAIVTQRQQQPAGGKESAPAPNPWSGEKQCKNTEFPSSAASPLLHRCLVLTLPVCLFVFFVSLSVSWCVCQNCKKTSSCKMHLYLSKSINVFEMGQFPLWQEMCVYLLVLKTTPWAEMRNPNQPPPPSPPLINCLAWFTSCFLHAHSHLLLCVSLCSLEVFFLTSCFSLDSSFNSFWSFFYPHFYIALCLHTDPLE